MMRHNRNGRKIQKRYNEPSRWDNSDYNDVVYFRGCSFSRLVYANFASVNLSQFFFIPSFDVVEVSDVRGVLVLSLTNFRQNPSH